MMSRTQDKTLTKGVKELYKAGHWFNKTFFVLTLSGSGGIYLLLPEFSSFQLTQLWDTTILTDKSVQIHKGYFSAVSYNISSLKYAHDYFTVIHTVPNFI